MNYVAQREQELKAKYQTEMWWIQIVKLWDTLGKAMSLQRDAEYYTNELNKIRSQYIRKGRPVGWRKAAA